MNNFNNETSRRLVLQAYNTIMDMLSFDNLYNNNHENIFTQIMTIEHMKPFIPRSIFDLFTTFIDDNIIPIIENESALEEFQTEELGFTKDDGKLFIGHVMQHCINLQEKFLELAMNEISPYFQ